MLVCPAFGMGRPRGRLPVAMGGHSLADSLSRSLASRRRRGRLDGESEAGRQLTRDISQLSVLSVSLSACLSRKIPMEERPELGRMRGICIDIPRRPTGLHMAAASRGKKRRGTHSKVPAGGARVSASDFSAPRVANCSHSCPVIRGYRCRHNSDRSFSSPHHDSRNIPLSPVFSSAAGRPSCVSSLANP